MNLILPPDTKQRQQALNVTQSFIVQAPAGSGKTELLTQRVLALLATVKQPEEIVAITFTRKAAAEMRIRILKALQKAALPEPTQEHEKQTWLLAKAALSHSYRLNWHLLENPNRLRVTTIDALCLNLVGQMPVLSRMGIQPKVVENPEKIYLAAIQKIFQHIDRRPDKYADSLKKVFRYFHHDIEYMTTLFQKMLQYREQWLPYALHGQTDEFQIRLQESLYIIISDALNETSELVNSNTAFSSILNILNYASCNLAATDYGPIIDAWPGTDPAYLTAWQRIADICLTNDNNWRKKITIKEGFPAENHFKNSEEKATAKQYKTQFMQFLMDMSENNVIRQTLENVRNLPSPDHYESQWDLISALLNVLTLLAVELRVQFQAVGKTDFIEIACAAKDALGNQDDPTELLLALDNQIQHLLVDEFQDTSKLQFELIGKLISGWQNNDGRSLFLVGDPMQSIYRFRQAEVGLFIKACQEGIGELTLTPLKLTTNFRSDEKIVHWINNAFKDAFPANNDIPSGAIQYAPSDAMRQYGENTGINLHPHYDDEGFQLSLLKQLHDTLSDDNQKTIAILVRSRKNAQLILPWLRAAKLPYQAIDIESLELQPLIYDLLALTKALIYLGDKTAWFAILRAPWCGLMLNDLLNLAKNQPKTCLWETVSTFNTISELSNDAKSRLTRIVPILTLALEQRFRLSMRQMIEHTWIALGGPACIPARSTLNDATSFFTLLETFSHTEGLFDIVEFERQLKEAYAIQPIMENTRINIMTMHKSKGLEFDTVILPALHELPRNDDKDILVWMDQPRSQQDENDILLAMCQPAGVDSDKLYKYIRAQEKQKATFENTRILYVAATRAKQQLHLYFKVEQDPAHLLPNTRGFLSLLWPTIEPAVFALLPELVITDIQSAGKIYSQQLDFGPDKSEQVERVYTQYMTEEEQASNHVPNSSAKNIHEKHDATIKLHRLPANWQLSKTIRLVHQTSSQNEEVKFDWQPDLERRMGIVLHRLFKLIGKQGLDAWQQFAAKQQIELIRQFCSLAGITNSQFFQVKSQILMCLEKMVQSQHGQWLLKQLTLKTAALEFAIETIQKSEIKQFILDATFIDEMNTRWIIDYKTTHPATQQVTTFLEEQKQLYAPQLEAYGELIAQMEKNPIKLVLYFPLFDEWLEWDMPRS